MRDVTKIHGISRLPFDQFTDQLFDEVFHSNDTDGFFFSGSRWFSDEGDFMMPFFHNFNSFRYRSVSI